MRRRDEVRGVAEAETEAQSSSSHNLSKGHMDPSTTGQFPLTICKLLCPSLAFLERFCIPTKMSTHCRAAPPRRRFISMLWGYAGLALPSTHSFPSLLLKYGTTTMSVPKVNTVYTVEIGCLHIQSMQVTVNNKIRSTMMAL